MTVPETTLPPANHHRRVFWATTGFFLFCAVVLAIYLLAWGRFHKRTDDAYVNGNLIVLTPQEPGIVVSILADNAQMVEEGDPVLQLDPHDFMIAFEKAEAQLGDSVRLVSQMFFKVEELKAKKEVSELQVMKTQLDYNHRAALVEDAGVSREDYEHSEIALLSAIASLNETEQELAGAIARIANTTLATHPLVQQAKSILRNAFLALHRCTVLAPARGIITQRRAQVGQWVMPNDPLMALVPLDQMWVDANFREVDLKNFRIGQPVSFFADMYGRRQKFHGKILGLNPGTGSVFSVLPPQNATGNWIKIVQRVPVKISIDPEEIKKRPLMLGLSITTTVDTHDRSGVRLAQKAESLPIYQTDVYAKELAGVEKLIEQIIANNLEPSQIKR